MCWMSHDSEQVTLSLITSSRFPTIPAIFKLKMHPCWPRLPRAMRNIARRTIIIAGGEPMTYGSISNLSSQVALRTLCLFPKKPSWKTFETERQLTTSMKCLRCFCLKHRRNWLKSTIFFCCFTAISEKLPLTHFVHLIMLQ